MHVDVNCLFEEIGNLPEVEAIALGGSRATGRSDEKSDYDVYVYITGDIPEISAEMFWKNIVSIWRWGIPFGNLRTMLR